jgi:hypothetical protein
VLPQGRRRNDRSFGTGSQKALNLTNAGFNARPLDLETFQGGGKQ